MTGIYRIDCLETGGCYVGQAVDVYSRLLSHFKDLGAGKHISRAMQADFNKYGRKAFTADIISECVPEELNAHEWGWMLTIRPSYNTKRPDYEAIDRGEAATRPAMVSRGPINVRRCERCGIPRVAGQKYCSQCKRVALIEMKRAGYLQPLPPVGRNRTVEHKEATWETKHGVDV